MKKYLLTLRVPFEAPDDPEARKIAEGLEILQHGNVPTENMKLQEVYDSWPPRSVPWRKK